MFKSLSATALIFFLCTIIHAVPPETYQDLRWRLLGPLRAGWSTCAEGIPDEPDTYYFGAADGGVWKTLDAGLTWTSIADHAPFSAVGALAIAPGSPRTIYVGTGQVDTRYDIMEGSGIYKSIDDGTTWQSLGLAETLHIGRIWIDPRDPKTLLVAALGPVFGASADRGVYRSEDGGQHWKQVLFVNEHAGAVDLAADPAYPDLIYAALWQVELEPWLSYFAPEVGPGSGIWKSTDAGKTWSQTSRNGLPDVPMSRIGLAVASGSGGRRVYASVLAPNKSGIFRTDDGGESWTSVNDDASLASSYFGRLTPNPNSPDIVYATGVALKRSTDGGRTFNVIKGAPGGDDYHFFWINPKHPDHSVVASDQGTAVTVNGGKTWSAWYNQATGQFYHVSADNRYPYWIYSAQQDSGTAAVVTRSDYGQLTFRDWHPVGGDERDFVIPDPQNPNIVFASGLGGRLSRWDALTGRVTNVSPWPTTTYGQRPTTIKYRYNWITPIAISQRPPYALYHGAQILFRSTDKGQSWATISPDLTGISPQREGCDGDVTRQQATACGYGVINSIAPSAVADGLIWVGTDNGRVMITRNEGKDWDNVTPGAVADWSKIATVEASPTDPATAYIAVDRHRLNDRNPYAFRTHDYGKTWTAIAQGIPPGAYVNVIRQDPANRGLLYAGTRLGAYVSFDDGDHWQPLQLNLPPTGINDLLVHENDLIAATQGRALWIVDDVTPLRHNQLPAPALVPPAPAIRISKNENRDTPLPPEVPTTPNPPAGAVIDYFLPAALAGPVTLEIVDAAGSVVRSYSSAQTPERPKVVYNFADIWLQPWEPLPARAGHNRFVWDLRGPRPLAPEYEYSIAAVPDEDTPLLPQGCMVLPGRYKVRLNVNGKATEQPLEVKQDPRSAVRLEDLAAQLAFYDQVAASLAGMVEKYAATKSKDPLFQSAESKKISEATRALTELLKDLEGADGPPTGPQRQIYAEYAKGN